MLIQGDRWDKQVQYLSLSNHLCFHITRNDHDSSLHCTHLEKSTPHTCILVIQVSNRFETSLPSINPLFVLFIYLFLNLLLRLNQMLPENSGFIDPSHFMHTRFSFDKKCYVFWWFSWISNGHSANLSKHIYLVLFLHLLVLYVIHYLLHIRLLSSC